MEQATKNVFVETKVRGCNPGYVVTSDGVVVIDTPQLPTRAIKMREEAEAKGSIRYIINTEHHVDHIFGNYYFKGAGTVVSHVAVYNEFMTVTPELDPYNYAKEALPTDDPEGVPFFPDEQTYFADNNKPTVTITGDATLRVGKHTFELLHTPGHSHGELAVYIPEERIVFAHDTIFHQCQTWLYASDVSTWIKSLDRLKGLDVDIVVPGHGPICTKREIAVQKAFLLEWVSTVASLIARGLSKEECIQHMEPIKNRFPVDIGQEYMLDFVIEKNTFALYEKMV